MATTECPGEGGQFCGDLDVAAIDNDPHQASRAIKGLGPDIHALLRGTLDLSGPKPRIDVREIKAGNLPGPFGDADRIISNFVNKSIAAILAGTPN
jgi:hypothetical protein